MARALPQTAVITIEYADGTSYKKEVPGTTTKNVRSKLAAALDTVLVGYATDRGCTIRIDLDPPDAGDDFSNPDR